MKRKLFIGSSSEANDVAEQLKSRLEAEMGDFLTVEKWNDGGIFSLNKGTLDSLMIAARKFDYGVLVATKDDVSKIRKVEYSVPRDNIMLEMGMFLGSLGLTRAFLLVEEHNKLPTDYNGVTVPYFDRDKDGSLNDAISKITEAIDKTRNSYNIRPVPSAALALGYFESFVQKLAKKKLEEGTDFSLKVVIPENINDIETTTNSYKFKNKSKEISLYGDGKRPIVFHYENDENFYWDIPTTLSTLNKLMNLISPSSEIGFDQDKQEWIKHELRNFKGTIEILAEQCDACNSRVQVVYT